MTAAQWQEVLCRVRSLSATDKDRLLTYLHALHDAAAPESRIHAEHAQGTVKPPPGWQRAFQALSLPNQPRKFPAL